MSDARMPGRNVPPVECRLSHEPPAASAKRGWRYHHIGIPTDVAHPGETYLAPYGLHVSGFTTSPYGVEWMRFERASPLPELIKTVPHVAFEVDDLDAALEGQEVIYPPGSPSEGVRSAMIVDHGAPIELIWFRKKSDVASASTPDHAAIHAVAEALRRAVNAGDVRDILECWTPDGVLMPPHHASIHGRAAIAEHFHGVFATRRMSFTFTGSSVALHGDVALERLTYTVVTTSVTGGVAVKDVGKGLHVYARQPDGRWRIAQDIWNSDQA